MKDYIARISDALLKEYAPQAIILYGSYADGSYDEDSDFDALIICDEIPAAPRSDVLFGVRLDVHFAQTERLRENFDPQEYLQVYDGVLMHDKNGAGARLIDTVRAFVHAQPFKTQQEKEHLLNWCDKMLLRSQRGDAEGDFRLHWLLTESLMIYCDVCDWYYFGPKKTIMRLKTEDEQAYNVYAKALKISDHNALQMWIDVLRTRLNGNEA